MYLTARWINRLGNQARRVADYCALFWTDNGSGYVLEDGTKETMFQHPVNEITAA